MSLPQTFCWTKMQAEAGQPLESIVARKELERLCTGGGFFWGIGSALGQRFWHWIERGDSRKVLFSPMLSSPKAVDSRPSAVVAWLRYSDRFGVTHRMPPGVLVTSKATTATGKKRTHYALTCRSTEPLTLRPRFALGLNEYRNLGSTSQRIGDSQTTALLERKEPDLACLSKLTNKEYDVPLVAELDHPYFVRLCEPVTLLESERDFVADLSLQAKDAARWLAGLETLVQTLETRRNENLFPIA
jgi:hypothetical protein